MPKFIGRYTIESELGRGAFGRVYRAFDPNLKIYVAIKELLSDDEDLLARFQTEARANAGLLHKNIVTVYEFGQHDGKPYLVMELLEGQTLSAVIALGGIGLLEKVEIMYEVAEGLQYAHSKGVVHRDMKPGNIMVVNGGAAKILDFGIARLLDKSGTRRSWQGDFAGTIPYMAPELFHGGKGDKLADIWGYGVVYYELLTGTQPFASKDPGAAMYRIDTYEPPRLREIVPETPAALDLLVQRLMTKERDLRVERMEDVLIDTHPILQQLRRTRAAAIAAEIRPRVESGGIEAVKGQVDEILKLDPLNVEAAGWREQRLSKLQSEVRKSKAEDLLRRGVEYMAARRWSDAIRCFENCLSLDGSQPEAASLLERAKADQERTRAASRLLAEAHWESQQKRLDKALEIASKARELDPQGAEAVRLCDELRQQIRDRRLAEVLSRADDFRKGGDYAGAVAALDELEQDLAETEQASRMRTRIEADRAEAERRRRAGELQEVLARARESLTARQLQDAEATAQSLCSRFPEQPAAADFLAEVREHIAAQRRADAIQAIIETAQAFVEDSRFEEARSALDIGLSSYLGEARLEQLRSKTAALEAAHVREQGIRAALEQASGLREEGELDQALLVAGAALAKFGSEPALVECKMNLEADQARRNYVRQLDQLLGEAMLFQAENRPEEAVRVLEKASARYSNESEFVKVLASAHQAAGARRQQQALREAQERVAALEKQEQFGSALAEADTALQQHPGNPALLEVAARLREQVRERARERALTAHAGRIQAMMQTGDFERAAANLQNALLEFPDEPRLTSFTAALQEGRREAELSNLEHRVHESLRHGDFGGAAERLTATRALFSEQATWITLWAELRGSLTAAEDRLPVAIQWFEQAVLRHPNEIELARTLAAARAAADALRMKRLREALDRVAGEETAGRYSKAAAEVESALKQYGDDANLRAAAERLAGKLRDEERARALEATVRRIQKSIRDVSLERAAEELAAAQTEFGADPALAAFPAEIRQARRAAELKSVETHARQSISRREFKDAVALLSGTRAAFSDEPGWQKLWQELERSVLADPKRLPDAMAMLEAAGPLDSGGQEVKRILDAARQAAASMREELLTRALQRAADMEAAGRFSDAAREAESLLAPHPDDPGLPDAARRLIETLEQAKARCEWFNKVRSLLPQEDFACTERAVKELAERYPDHPQARALLGAVREERERREREARREQARAEAKQNLGEKQFDAAIQILSDLLREFPSDGSLRTDLQAAEASKRRAEREESYARGRAEVAELLQTGQHEAAIHCLKALLKEFPADADIEQDMEAAKAAKASHERQQAAVRAREKAERLIGNQNFSSAMQILQPLSEQFPEDEAIRQDWQAAVAGDAALRLRAAVAQRLAAHEFDQVRELLAEARQAASPETEITALEAELVQAQLREQQESEARAHRLKQGRAEAEQHLQEKQFDTAVRILRDLIRDFPGDAALDQELVRAEASRDADQRQRACEQAREKAKRMIANGKFDAAIRVLEPFRQEFPRDKVLQGLLQAAAAAKKRAARPNWLQIYETMAEIETLYAKGKAAKVQERTRELLAEVEEPRARELLKWAEAAVARESQESRSPLWAGLAGIVDRAASLLGGREAEEGQLRVSTAEVSFSIPAGAPGVPPPAAVAVTSESAWTVHAGEPWMVVEQQTGGVAITVNSRGLRAGSYSGSLVILTAVGRGRQEVRVKLTVEP